ncbi:type II secretion system protein [Amycolatopsis sp. WAC 04197]|uniref:type II secretion system F family protein n=1 Tax=Amycolatopsis sp. WAC 04197 TaxID=2203199 RepID=UPI000F77EB3F|nr:type II secretion system F family protein [Amycolatopsis sp. WAC 04197]RSN45128.1 type II secretion system protein [Amycolatopsis sp. WAC 04197]
MSTLGQLILLALGVAGGTTLVLAAYLPGRLRLSDVLDDRPAAPVSSSTYPVLQAMLRFADRCGARTPTADLDLVGKTREAFMLNRLGYAFAGILAVPLTSLAFAVVGAGTPVFLTAAMSLGAAVLGWTLPRLVLRSEAQKARAAFRGALVAYSHLVALGRLGDRGPVEAMRYPATLGDGWAFQRLRLAMNEASLGGRMPWEGLERLADELDVRELRDLGHIITSAGESGASIADTLRSKAASIAQQGLADQKAGASVRSDRMDMPIAVMGLAFIVFLAFPGIYTMIGS